jgi:uncharacterized protein YpmB
MNNLSSTRWPLCRRNRRKWPNAHRVAVLIAALVAAVCAVLAASARDDAERWQAAAGKAQREADLAHIRQRHAEAVTLDCVEAFKSVMGGNYFRK